MANSHLSNINFAGISGTGGPMKNRWVSVIQIDSTGGIDPVATGTLVHIHSIRASLVFAAITDVFAVVRLRLTDAAGNLIWGGGTGNGQDLDVQANGFSVDWVSEIGTNPVAEVTVIYDHLEGAAPTAV